MSARRNAPYPGVGAGVVLAETIWTRTLRELREYGESSSEGLVFWGGVVVNADLLVTGLYLPKHSPQGGRARLTSEESRWLLRALRIRDEKLLAQVHSHPGSAFHSTGDDNLAASFHSGYLSVVVPQYARDVTDVEQCAVFEFDGSSFFEIPSKSISQRFAVRSLVESRRPERPQDTEIDKVEGWLRTIVSNLKQKLTELRKLLRSSLPERSFRSPRGK